MNKFYGSGYTVDYFDSFKLCNRYNELCRIIEWRKDKTAEVEIGYPVVKRIIVPNECVNFINITEEEHRD